jgi:hypothetical protein
MQPGEKEKGTQFVALIVSMGYRPKTQSGTVPPRASISPAIDAIREPLPANL